MVMKVNCKNDMNIGLLGAAINNTNMGCVALTYSLLFILEKIKDQCGFEFTYYVFDRHPDLSKTDVMCKQLGIDKRKLVVLQEGRMGSWKRILWNIWDNIRELRFIKKSSMIIDITQGDSFTDIYGKYRFYNYTRMKRLVNWCNVPLVLGPQTYGPFIDEKDKDYAISTIKKARYVIARDERSASFLKENGIENVGITTDLAFFLPYEEVPSVDSDKIKIGINISGLLVKDKVEKTIVDFSLNTDYDHYILSVIDWLEKQGTFDIYIIAHVYEDYLASKEIVGDRKEIQFVKIFDSPIEAKSKIATMDVFIGARMHATIAAFSTGVITIPTAYSRKFIGLFESLGYKHIIDLENDSTDISINKTIEMLQNLEDIRNDMISCSSNIKSFKDKTYDMLYKIIVENCGKKQE